MRVVLLKGLSLAVSIGTLAYIVTHAAANTGCAASPSRGEPQIARSDSNAVATKSASPAPPSNCAPVYMMPPTKAAPVFRADECNPSADPPEASRPRGKAQPVQQGQALQQAP